MVSGVEGKMRRGADRGEEKVNRGNGEMTAEGEE